VKIAVIALQLVVTPVTPHIQHNLFMDVCRTGTTLYVSLPYSVRNCESKPTKKAEERTISQHTKKNLVKKRLSKTMLTV